MWEKLDLAHSSAAVRFLTSSKTIANQSSTPLSPPCTECVLAWILKREKEIMRAKNFWLEEIDGISKINAIIPVRTWGNLLFFLIPLYPICPQVPLPPPPKCLSYPSIPYYLVQTLASLSLTRILSQSPSWAFVQLILCTGLQSTLSKTKI